MHIEIPVKSGRALAAICLTLKHRPGVCKDMLLTTRELISRPIGKEKVH